MVPAQPSRYAPAAAPRLVIRLEVSGLPTATHDNGGDDANTTTVANGSSALLATAGPEVGIPVGRGHFYAVATGGVARLWASSAAFSGPTPAFGPFSTVSSTHATNFAWSGGGGFVEPLSSGRFPVSAEIGIRYYDLGRVTYTTEYPSVDFGAPGTPTKAYSTIGHHQTTLFAPSAGLIWRL